MNFFVGFRGGDILVLDPRISKMFNCCCPKKDKLPSKMALRKTLAKSMVLDNQANNSTMSSQGRWQPLGSPESNQENLSRSQMVFKLETLLTPKSNKDDLANKEPAITERSTIPSASVGQPNRTSSTTESRSLKNSYTSWDTDWEDNDLPEEPSVIMH